MKVIIVDNETEVAEHLQRQMKQVPEIGEITVFNDPLEALEYADRQSFDVAFLDIEMPKMAGIELAKRLKVVNAKVNIVFITGYSQYAIESYTLEASDYLLKPTTPERIGEALGRLRNPVLAPTSRIRVQAFGNFEIFADGKPISFARSKSKELLAYLIDRKGAGVSKKELSSVLWEDGEHSRQRQLHLQTYVTEMMKALKAVSAEHIIIKGHDSLSVDRAQFDCDYYRYLEGESRAFNMYTGEYMVNYSWAEFTNASLEAMR